MTLLGLGNTLARWHLVFAVGIVPLIFGAMIHFIPVLTRSGDPSGRISRLPWLAQGAGLLLVLAMLGVLPYEMRFLAIVVDMSLCALLFNWLAERVRAAVGTPHPGWRWYGAALGCLMMALLAELLVAAWPHYWRALRLFHLHLNTIGLLGLAALGTLPVLMPTALGKADSEAGSWLNRRLWLVAGGALVVATGSAVDWLFAAPGATLVLVAALSLIGQWGRRFGLRALFADGVSASLLSAVLGLILCLVAGIAHGAGVLPGRPTLTAWVIGFLLPLVSGALCQLLPVWRWPGPVIAERRTMREKMAAGGRWRAVLFFIAAVAVLAGFERLAWILLMLAGLLFVGNLLQAVRVSRPTR